MTPFPASLSHPGHPPFPPDKNDVIFIGKSHHAAGLGPGDREQVLEDGPQLRNRHKDTVTMVCCLLPTFPAVSPVSQSPRPSLSLPLSPCHHAPLRHHVPPCSHIPPVFPILSEVPISSRFLSPSMSPTSLTSQAPQHPNAPPHSHTSPSVPMSPVPRVPPHPHIPLCPCVPPYLHVL